MELPVAQAHHTSPVALMGPLYSTGALGTLDLCLVVTLKEAYYWHLEGGARGYC